MTDAAPNGPVTFPTRPTTRKATQPSPVRSSAGREASRDHPRRVEPQTNASRHSTPAEPVGDDEHVPDRQEAGRSR